MSAKGKASGGVRIQVSSECVSASPARLMMSDRPRKNTALVPTTRFASAMFLAPTHCATMMVEAIEKPNIRPNSRNITTFAFPTAARAASPRYFPTQMALTDPLIDCSTLPNRMGSENAIKAGAIDPSVNECLGGTPGSIIHQHDRRRDYSCEHRRADQGSAGIAAAADYRAGCGALSRGLAGSLRAPRCDPLSFTGVALAPGHRPRPRRIRYRPG